MACFNENKANLCSKKLSAIFVNHVLICFIYCNSFILVYRYIYIYICMLADLQAHHLGGRGSFSFLGLQGPSQAHITDSGSQHSFTFSKDLLLANFSELPCVFARLGFSKLGLGRCWCCPKHMGIF